MLNKKLTTAITTFTAVATLLIATPAAFADQSVITGNGAVSDNQINRNNNTATTAVLSNTANISNTVNSVADSGHNDASYNTGGVTTIVSGAATNGTSIQNMVNDNALQLNGGCNTCGQGAGVLIGVNGAFSNNAVNASSNNSTSAFETNHAYVSNDVNSNANTGYNNGDYNTGSGTFLLSGPATNHTFVGTEANKNMAQIEGSNGIGGFGTTAEILGNGAQSTSEINLNRNNATVLSQDNTAYVDNYIRSSANSGYNDASFNTGGFDSIVTGPATNLTSVRNLLNANTATVTNGCGCDNNSLFKIGLNGAFSTNDINGNSNSTTSLFGTNYAGVNNDMQSKASSGYNSLSYETGGLYGISDPSVTTGSSYSQTIVDNQANVNTAQVGAMMTPFGAMDFNFNPMALIGL